MSWAAFYFYSHINFRPSPPAPPLLRHPEISSFPCPCPQTRTACNVRLNNDNTHHKGPRQISKCPMLINHVFDEMGASPHVRATFRLIYNLSGLRLPNHTTHTRIQTRRARTLALFLHVLIKNKSKDQGSTLFSAFHVSGSSSLPPKHPTLYRQAPQHE